MDVSQKVEFHINPLGHSQVRNEFSLLIQSTIQPHAIQFPRPVSQVQMGLLMGHFSYKNGATGKLKAFPKLLFYKFPLMPLAHRIHYIHVNSPLPQTRAIL